MITTAAHQKFPELEKYITEIAGNKTEKEDIKL
jgi:hypothetical protein